MAHHFVNVRKMVAGSNLSPQKLRQIVTDRHFLFPILIRSALHIFRLILATPRRCNHEKVIFSLRNTSTACGRCPGGCGDGPRDAGE